MANPPTQSVFALVLARPVQRRDGMDPAMVHLWWSAPAQGARLVQVYVNRQLYDVALDAAQRTMWLVLDRRRSHAIELLAIDPHDAEGVWQPRPAWLQSWSPQVQPVASARLIRDETLPVDTQVRVEIDGTLIDRSPLWPAQVGRSGFGALFGEGGFGVDAATGPGLGQGALGHGPLGSDGTSWQWQRGDLSAAAHQVTFHAEDATGEPVAEALTTDITIDRLPEPAQDLNIDETFKLTWR
jgi:hypothetical protein